MKWMKRPAMATVTICAVLWLGCLNALAQDNTDASELDRLDGPTFWASILKKQPRLEGFTEWEQEAVDPAVAFNKLYDVEDAAKRREILTFFVDQFGKHGWEADFRWIMAAPYCIVASHGRYTPLTPISKRAEMQNAISDEVCELIVLRCLREPEFLRRYYHAVAWSRAFLGNERLRNALTQPFAVLGAMEHTAEGFRKQTPGTRWWFARNYILLAYAFSQEERLKSPDEISFAEQFGGLDRWFKENQLYIRPNHAEYRWQLDEDAQRRQIPVYQGELIDFVKIPKHALPEWKGPDLGASFFDKFD